MHENRVLGQSVRGDNVKKILCEYCFSTIVILFLSILIGFGALCLVYLIPVERMYSNAEVAQDMVSEESTTYSIFEIKSMELDNYTDSIMVSTAICPKDASLFEKAVYNYHVSYLKGYLEQENLRQYLTGQEGYDYIYYSHYWNGYLLFLKPLLFLFEYNDILLFNIMAQMLMIIWGIIGMVKNKKEFLILPFLVTMFSIGVPLATSQSIQLSDIFYVAMLGSGIIIWNYKRLDSKKIYFLFLILGVMTSYFDFLTYPLISLGLPLIIYIACEGFSKPIESSFKTIINSIGWAVGYVGMWLGKGVLGSLMYPDSQALETGIGHFFMRSSGNVGTIKVGFSDVLLKNMFIYINWPILIVIVFVALAFMIKMVIKRNMKKEKLIGNIPYLIVMLYPFAWFMVMKNHSYQHTYVYRVLAIAVFAGLSMLAGLAQDLND